MRSAPSQLLLIIVAGILFAWSPLSLAMAQQQQQQQTPTTGGTGAATTPPSTTTPSLTPLTPPLTPQEQQQQIRLQNVIASTTLNLQETQKQIAGVVFTPRWSQPVWVNANSVAVLVAYCLPGEFADAGQEILGGFGLEILESYGVALPQGFMAWMAVVGNEDVQNRRLPAALGVMCASDLNKPETRVLSPEKQQEINNINEQFINIQNTQINDIDNLINVINTVTTTTTTTTPVTPPAPGQNRTGGGAGGTTTLAAAPVQDTIPPTLIGPEDVVTEITSEQSGRVRYAVTAQDNVDGTAKLEADGITITQDNVGGNIAISCDIPSGSEFLSGETLVPCVATDQAGNAFRNSFAITVTPGNNGTTNSTGGGTTTLAAAPVQQQDTTPPTLVVPEDIVVDATSAEGAVVTFRVTAQDNVDGTATLDENNILTQDDAAGVYPNLGGTPPMSGGSGGTMGTPSQPIGGDIKIASNPPSGSVFPIGETTVEFKATDSAGNYGLSSVALTVIAAAGETISEEEGNTNTPAQNEQAPPVVVDEQPSPIPHEPPSELPALQTPPVIIDEEPSSDEPPAEDGGEGDEGETSDAGEEDGGEEEDEVSDD